MATRRKCSRSSRANAPGFGENRTGDTPSQYAVRAMKTYRPPTSNDAVLRRGDFIAPVLHEIRKVIVGQDYLVNRLLLGLAKTLAVKTLSDTIEASFKRVQFTPDLLPADLNGTMIYNPADQTFRPRLGPIFTDILLADEVNRAPPKVQSALLEAMQEKQVSIGGTTHPL